MFSSGVGPAHSQRESIVQAVVHAPLGWCVGGILGYDVLDPLGAQGFHNGDFEVVRATVDNVFQGPETLQAQFCIGRVCMVAQDGDNAIRDD